MLYGRCWKSTEVSDHDHTVNSATEEELLRGRKWFRHQSRDKGADTMPVLLLTDGIQLSQTVDGECARTCGFVGVGVVLL